MLGRQPAASAVSTAFWWAQPAKEKKERSPLVEEVLLCVNLLSRMAGKQTGSRSGNAKLAAPCSEGTRGALSAK